MSLLDLINQIPPGYREFGVIIALMSLVEVMPVKLNPWRWIKSFMELPSNLEKVDERLISLEKRLNEVEKRLSEIDARVEELREKTENLDTEYHHDKAYGWRAVILSRADQVRHKEKLSQDRWDDTIDTIDRYERYCEEQEKIRDSKFINNKAKSSIELLVTKYPEVLANNDFLM